LWLWIEFVLQEQVSCRQKTSPSTERSTMDSNILTVKFLVHQKSAVEAAYSVGFSIVIFSVKKSSQYGFVCVIK
jgi:hypothetical protein